LNTRFGLLNDVNMLDILKVFYWKLIPRWNRTSELRVIHVSFVHYGIYTPFSHPAYKSIHKK